MAGVVLNPATPVAVLEDVLEVADYVLLMSVNPGFGGQKLIPYVLEKARKLDRMRREKKLALPIEIDGGVHPENLAEVVRAGCDWIVTGSAIFHSPDPEATTRRMREIASQATAIADLRSWLNMVRNSLRSAAVIAVLAGLAIVPGMPPQEIRESHHQGYPAARQGAFRPGRRRYRARPLRTGRA